MNKALTFDDVTLVPSYCPFDSRKDVDTSCDLGFGKIDIPIISAPMDTISEEEMAVALSGMGGVTLLHRFMEVDNQVTMYKSIISRLPFDKHHLVGVAFGVAEKENQRIDALYELGCRLFCLDVAHGHSKFAGKAVKKIKTKYPDTFVIAGSVCTLAGADYLASCGADMLRVGIGGSGVCTTRVKTGFGVPLLTAVMDCARGSKPIIADGGIRIPGDVVKSFAGGANLVMLGGMLSATDETPGEATDGFKAYRGMASSETVEKHFGEMPEWKTAEGISVKIPCKGPVKNVIQDLIGGLRSGMTYCGAYTLDEIQRKAQFVEITNAGTLEGRAHINK